MSQPYTGVGGQARVPVPFASDSESDNNESPSSTLQTKGDQSLFMPFCDNDSLEHLSLAAVSDAAVHSSSPQVSESEDTKMENDDGQISAISNSYSIRDASQGCSPPPHTDNHLAEARGIAINHLPRRGKPATPPVTNYTYLPGPAPKTRNDKFGILPTELESVNVDETKCFIRNMKDIEDRFPVGSVAEFNASLDRPADGIPFRDNLLHPGMLVDIVDGVTNTLGMRYLDTQRVIRALYAQRKRELRAQGDARHAQGEESSAPTQPHVTQAAKLRGRHDNDEV